MRHNKVQMCLSTAVALSLGGCALFPGGKPEPTIRASSTLPTGSQAFASFEVARAALRQRNYASAIVAFSKAREEPELLGASLNGMGVAYAELGRADLAERYFRQAIRAAPDDGRFAANLAKLLESEMVPVAPRLAERAPEFERPNSSGLAGAQRLTRPRITVAPTLRVASSEPNSQLTRVNPGAVHLTTVAPGDVELALATDVAQTPRTEISQQTPASAPEPDPKRPALIAELKQETAKVAWFDQPVVDQKAMAVAAASLSLPKNERLTKSAKHEPTTAVAKVPTRQASVGGLAEIVSGTMKQVFTHARRGIRDELDQFSDPIPNSQPGLSLAQMWNSDEGSKTAWFASHDNDHAFHPFVISQ